MISLAEAHNSLGSAFSHSQLGLPLYLFQTAFGIVSAINFGLMWSAADSWYGEMFVSQETYLSRIKSHFLVLKIPFEKLSPKAWIGTGLVASILIAAGIQVQVMSLMMWLSLTYLQTRNPYPSGGSDQYHRILAGVLAISGQSTLSLAEMHWQFSEVSAWQINLLKIQFLFMEFQALYLKLCDPKWRSGATMDIILKGRFISRNNFINHGILKYGIGRVMTLSGLVLQSLAITALIFNETKLVGLGIFVMFHLIIELQLKTSLYQLYVFASLLLFV